MSRIPYFERYPLTIEDTVTHSILQLVAQIHDQSPTGAARLLSDLTGEWVQIGMEIGRRPWGEGSSSGGSIIQRGFKISVLATVDSAVSPDGLLRYAGSLAEDGEQQALLLVTRQPLGHRERAIAALIGGSHPNVVFRNVTYWGLCDMLQRTLLDCDAGMVALIEDYCEYCDEMELFDTSRTLLRVVPCARSLELSKKFGVYFQSSDRGHGPEGVVGLYAGGRVQVILNIRSVFDADLLDGNLVRKLLRGEDTDEFDPDVRRLVEEAGSHGYRIATGTRFFCGDVFATDFRKSSAGEIPGSRFVDITQLLCGTIEPSDMAERLKGLEW